jgi:hypothetical protein
VCSEGWARSQASIAASKPDWTGAATSAGARGTRSVIRSQQVTETTQPDPQVMSWMYRWRRDNPRQDGGPAPTKVRTIHAWLGAHGFDSLAESPHSLRDLVDAYNAAQKPMTVADIPAGQGPTSLFIAPDSTGVPRVYYKDADGDITAWSYSADSRHGAARAMWEHLAATLPTVDETP